MFDQAATAAAGVAAGVLSGLFGVGGALITTPFVRLVLERPGLVAVGTPLAVVVPTALVGAVTHARAGTADVRSGLVLGASGVPLAVLGALTSSVIGAPAILLATAVTLAYVAAGMWRAAGRPPRADHAQALTTTRLAAVGAAAGFLSGLMGLGGGFVMVPLLVGRLGFPVVRATGTSLIAVAMLAFPGAVTHAALGHVEWGLALLLAVGVVPGAVFGARLGRRLGGVVTQRAFAVFLLAGAVALAENELVVLLGG